jgi:hypothetical protein
VTKRRLIAADIVQKYTFIDELLGTIIARYFFNFGETNFRRLWRTKRFRRFNYFILKRMSTIQKMDLVKDIRPLPSSTVDYIQRVNRLRNAVAHAFFPENLQGSRTKYKDMDISASRDTGQRVMTAKRRWHPSFAALTEPDNANWGDGHTMGTRRPRNEWRYSGVRGNVLAAQLVSEGGA